ncbi:TrkH family potassium uptake protein [Faecalibacterium longum]|jgi:trk system potassium uptake protein TrkH|uniref:Potassium transporter TrkG n=1 Tax=Faecalibacterium longum TaxID=1851428 RepID=A0ABV1IPG1_9FIRM|nr:potassium transporter TrkG [Faecalibacterium longum]MCC2183426.1 potassium transporter Trk [Faecalibacterium longum CLA-AA-H236]
MGKNKTKKRTRRPNKGWLAGSSATQTICISFLLVIAVGTLLLTLPISSRTGRLGVIDAMFTATSATCVTGLIVRDTWSQFSLFGQVIILMLIQVGGLGLVTLTSFFALAARRRMGFRDLRLLGESVSADGLSKATEVLKIVIKLAAAFEAVGIVLLLFAFVPQFGAEGVWVSVFTAISAFCNAGFDLFGRFGAYSSLVPYVNNYYVQAVVMFMIMAGGLGFMVWVELAEYRKKRRLSLHAKVVLQFSVIFWVGGAVLLALLEWSNPRTMGGLSVPGKIMAALFQSVSTRTAGMNTIDLAACSPISKLLMSVLQFIGAAPGSTGGGVKVTTFAVLILTIRSVAQGRDDCVIGGHHIESKTVYRALTIIVIGAVAAFGSAVVVYYNTAETVSVIDCIFESCSAFGTVGLSVGVTGQLNTGAKLLYMACMFMGRVGPVSLAISLTAKPDDNKRKVLPVGHINVG